MGTVGDLGVLFDAGDELLLARVELFDLLVVEEVGKSGDEGGEDESVGGAV